MTDIIKAQNFKRVLGTPNFDPDKLTDAEKAELILNGICLDCGGKLPDHYLVYCLIDDLLTACWVDNDD